MVLMRRILVVDDEEHILELLEYNLEQEGYQALKADTGEKALDILKKEEVDLVILDWMLPGMNGIDVLKKIRSSENHSQLPVILLTAKGDEISKVLGLEIGADDYLTKPFGVHELFARIKAVLRRSNKNNLKKEEDEGIIIIGNLEVNPSRRTVTVDNELINLSFKEFELLYLLAENRGIVFTRNQLLERIWGYDYVGETRTVDVHISNLRKKIESDESHPVFIKTVRGMGYKFK